MLSLSAATMKDNSLLFLRLMLKMKGRLHVLELQKLQSKYVTTENPLLNWLN